MDWTTILIVVGAVGAVMLFKKAGQISADKAGELIREGAKVVDVRTPQEFSADAVPGVINIPLDRIAQDAPKKLTDKSQPILVHCLSGGRSMMAKRQLAGMGYSSVHNLGSLARAKSIVNANRTSQ
jgi:phage shock protein E